MTKKSIHFYNVKEDSAVAQQVEHLAVNQGVAGSNPARGAKHFFRTNHKNKRKEDLIFFPLTLIDFFRVRF